jgi:5-methylthioribose kinase
MEFSRLIEADVPVYLQSIPAMHAHFSSFDSLEVTEVGDGNLNFVYLVSNRRQAHETVVLKQAVPYLRVVGESWPLTRHRMDIETAALRYFKALCPAHVPEIYHADSEQSLVIMQRLGEHRILRGALLEGHTYTHVAEHLSGFMARSLFYGSDLFLPADVKKDAVKRFTNSELCKITEDLIFTHPYDDSASNSYNPALPQAEIDRIQRNPPLRAAVGALKYAFMTRAETLLHGDLHVGSVMVSTHETYVIDPEFAFYGPMGFDIGILLANFFLAWYGQDARGGANAETSKNWLLNTSSQCWVGFLAEFLQLWQQHEQAGTGFTGRDLDGASAQVFRDDFMSRLWQDSLGFAGCEMVRRVLGLAKVAEIAGIDNPQIRAGAEIKVLRLAERLLLERTSISNMAQLLEWVQA